MGQEPGTQRLGRGEEATSEVAPSSRPPESTSGPLVQGTSSLQWPSREGAGAMNSPVSLSFFPLSSYQAPLAEPAGRQRAGQSEAGKEGSGGQTESLELNTLLIP